MMAGHGRAPSIQGEMLGRAVNGVPLYWERAGSRPCLLFCNGSGSTLEDARLLVNLLSSKFDLLAWDYPGFGQSAPVTRPYTMPEMAADAVGLMETAGWRSCRVFGVSFVEW